MNSPLCIETIRLVDGQLSNLFYHNERLNRTRFACFGETMTWDLNELIGIPSDVREGVYKCRVTYGKTVEKIEFEPYQPRTVKTLRMVEDNTISYDFKFQDRSSLQRLFEKRENADDVLIVKDGLITDSSYANVVFWNGSQWLTPDFPLLKGTKRTQLLEDRIIGEERIWVKDVANFTHARLINAMLDFESTPLIEVAQIRF